MELQYQLSNGTSWINCADRTDEFLARCAEKNPALTSAEILARLARGEEILHGSEWYSYCRIKPAPRPAPAIDPRPILHCRKCGQTGHGGQYPFSTLVGSGRCDDCV